VVGSKEGYVGKKLWIVAALLLLGGCWNGGNQSIRLGDVSLGQQLIDLKTALDQGAVTEDEYQQLRTSLISLHAGCGEESSGKS
jgi:hypothetical protein